MCRDTMVENHCFRLQKQVHIKRWSFRAIKIKQVQERQRFKQVFLSRFMLLYFCYFCFFTNFVAIFIISFDILSPLRLWRHLWAPLSVLDIPIILASQNYLSYLQDYLTFRKTTMIINGRKLLKNSQIQWSPLNWIIRLMLSDWLGPDMTGINMMKNHRLLE
jgi:hypothetical protein